VKKVETFGAFVEIEGCKGTQGLVHVSQMAKDRVENAADIVSQGDEIYVKVITIEDGSEDRPKTRISLSMKYCSQSDGADRDPNGVLAEQDGRKRKPQHSGK
jgi:ribosomal protein S1